MENNSHIPVLLEEAMKMLQVNNKGVFVDATFGAGGYSREILKAQKENILYSFDRDITVKKYALELKKEYAQRFYFINNKFSQLKKELQKENITEIDGIVFDLGISSMQVDQAERGFSFAKEAKLSMQMGLNNISAYEVINSYKKEDLADIFYQLGDEKKSRHIASKIVAMRDVKNIETTKELADIIVSVKKFSYKDKIHPATKVFQALRIYVNEELGELKKALIDALQILKIGARIVVVSFHSIEDRIVKNFLKKHSNEENSNRYLPNLEKEKKSLKIITKKAIKPTLIEIKENPRARSSILRVAEKI